MKKIQPFLDGKALRKIIFEVFISLPGLSAPSRIVGSRKWRRHEEVLDLLQRDNSDSSAHITGVLTNPV